VAHTAGELFYYFLQMAWAAYRQLAAMQVLPQIAAGAYQHWWCCAGGLIKALQQLYYCE
jgi:hypothetical protein